MYRLLTLSLLVLVTGAHSLFAGPQVTVVTGRKAPSLEQFAARELASQFKKLFKADVTITQTVPTRTEHLILLGSPQTNPAVGKLAGKRWPKLSDQGHVLVSVKQDGRQALLVGGGSPVATLWAVYELGYHFGIRYFLHGDVMPALKPKLKLTGLNTVLEPTLKLRTWRTVNHFAIGPESWGLKEQKLVLRQLAKLKFNRVLLALHPWQPFVDYQFKGVQKKTGVLWYGWRYPVAGDTPGRAVFRGAAVFENPDFVGKTTYQARTRAGSVLARGIIDSAHELGMTVGIAFSPLAFPKEFASVLPGARIIRDPGGLAIGPGPKQALDDSTLQELARTQLRAYLATYPKVDALYLTLRESSGWDHHRKAWQRIKKRTDLGKKVTLAQLKESARKRTLTASGKRGVQALQGNLTTLEFLHHFLADLKLLQRKDGKKVELVIAEVDPGLYPILDKVLPEGASALHFLDDTARRVVANQKLLANVPANRVKSSLILTLADPHIGVLPQLPTRRLHTLLGQLRKHHWQGYSTRYWMPGDLNPAVHYLSRASFNSKVTPHGAYEDLLTPVLGPGVAPRVIKGFDMIEDASELIDQNDLGFTFPVPGVVMKHYKAGTAPPTWWTKVRDLYAGAMNEMYRGITRARFGARPILLYHAKRLEFAFHYLNSIEALRLAGQARTKGDVKKQLEELGKATEAMYNALTALGEVARDNSDRGVIAVLAAYGYRPLQAELEKVEKAADESSH